MTGEELREQLFRKLQRVFGKDNVETKWRASASGLDDFNSDYMYTPETDVAVGPYNINRLIEIDNRKINEALEYHKDFLNEINSIAEKPFDEHRLNDNPRCFIAIEAGGSGSRKHLLGDMFNASIMGKIGLVVGTDDKTVRIYKRIFEYINFAYAVGKTRQNLYNLAILDGSKFLTLFK